MSSSFFLDWIVQQPSFNTVGANISPSIATGLDDSIYVTYFTDSRASGQISTGVLYDIVVFKLDAVTGICQWIRQLPSFNTTGNNLMPSIVVDSLDQVYVAYQTNGSASLQTNSGVNDIVVFKLTGSTGVCQWVVQQPTFNTTGEDLVPRLTVDAGGNVYVAYYSDGLVSGQTPTGLTDIVVFRLDPSTGVCQWVAQQPTFNTSFPDEYPDLVADQMGHIILSYHTIGGTVTGQTNLGMEDIVVVQLDATTGNCVWVTQQPSYNTIGGDFFSSLSVDSGGSIYVTYLTDGTTSGQNSTGLTDVVVFKLNTTGQCQWVAQQPTFNTPDVDLYPRLRVTHTGAIRVTYFTHGTTSGQTNLGDWDVVVTQLDSITGQCQWVTQQPVFNTVNADTYPCLAIDLVGDIYVTYNTQGSISGQVLTGVLDVVVLKLSMIRPAVSITVYSGSINGSGIVHPGQMVTYTMTVTNTGNVPLSNVTLTDDLGTTIPLVGSLVVGETTTVMSTYAIVQSQIDQGYIHSQVTVEGTYLTETVTDFAETNVFIDRESGLALTKSTTATDYHVGDLIQYTFVVINIGNVTLHTLRLVDLTIGLDLPRSLLDASDTYTEVGTYLVTQADMDHGSLTNTATVSGLDPSQQTVMAETSRTIFPCLVGDTLILMRDGSYQPIQTIQPGEWVAPQNQVVRVCQTRIDPRSWVDLVMFDKDCLGSGHPCQPLLITHNHPLIYGQARRPASCFTVLKGVSTIRDTGLEILYDLQFDHDGSYVAQGIEVQSCSPHSQRFPLTSSEGELEVVWDCYDHPLPLNTECLLHLLPGSP